jgi:hypothetical protein
MRRNVAEVNLHSNLFSEEIVMNRIALAVTLLLIGFVGIVRAADDKPNPTGTWKWTVTFNDQSREVTLKLKLEGDKLTGTMSGRNNTETAIEDAKYKDGEVSFAVTRERDGQKSVTKYSGKVSGDTIKGKSKSDREGAQEREWEAKRAKE